MYRPNRVEAPQGLGYEMGFPTPNICFSSYHGIYSTTDSCQNGPPIPEKFTYASILPHHGHTNSQEWTVSNLIPRSAGLESDCFLLGTDLTFGRTGPDRNVNGGFNTSADSHCMLPSSNQSIPSGPFGRGLERCDLTPSFVSLDSFPSNFNLQGSYMPDHTMRMEPGSSHDVNSTGILNDDLQMHYSESFFFRQAGWYTSQQLMA
jgi:hypothetical protein